MKKLIISLNIYAFLLCSPVNGMDAPKPDPVFIVKGNDSEQGIEVSESTLKMSNVLKTMIEDLGGTTEVPLPLNSTEETIKSVFKILDMYKNDSKNPSIQQMISSSSLQQLTKACNLIELLHLKDPNNEIANNFINGLRQRLIALSPQEIEKNAEIIGSLMPEVQNKILRPLLAEVISNKRIEFLKQSGINPGANETLVIDLGFLPTAGAFSNDGKRVALGDNWGIIKIFNTQNNDQKPMKTFEDNRKIISIKFSCYDNFLIVARTDGNITIWDTHTYQIIGSLNTEGYFVKSIASSSDNKYIVAALRANFKNKVVIWQKEEKKSISYEQLYSIDDKYNFAGNFSSDGTCILLANENEWVLWDINKKEYSYTGQLPINPQRVEWKNLQFNQDNTQIIGLLKDLHSSQAKPTI